MERKTDTEVVHDPEPERYYDWMLWKMRQEDKGKKVMTKEDIYKKEIAEMQSSIHHLQVRVKELSEENREMKEQISRKDETKRLTMSGKSFLPFLVEKNF